MRRFGGFQIPLLSDPDHAAALAYGAWKPLPGGDKNDGEALHATFVIVRGGVIRWVSIGDRPFTDIDTLLNALDERAQASFQQLPRFATESWLTPIPRHLGC